MAETVSIEDQPYLKRNPLGVLGLTLVTLGIYFFYWYYKVNEELMRFEHDPSISPTRSLMAILFGWIIIVPPFIAIYNTAKHVQGVEQRMAIQPQLEPALVIVDHAAPVGRQRRLHPGAPQPDLGPGGERRSRPPLPSACATRCPRCRGPESCIAPTSRRTRQQLERMRALVERLDDGALRTQVNEHWTVAGVLGHIAFWDARVLALADKLERGEPFTPSEEEPEDRDGSTTRHAPVVHAVPPDELAALAVQLAEETDRRVASISARSHVAGGPRKPAEPLACGHRGEHLDEIEAVLGAEGCLAPRSVEA